MIPEVVWQCFVRSISAAPSRVQDFLFGRSAGSFPLVSRIAISEILFSSFISTLRQSKAINVLTKTDSQRLAGTLFVS